MKVVLGGTFDPVHVGHLRMATELAEVLAVEAVDLMPCYQAVHKSSVSADSEQRLAMLKLSLANDSCLRVDDREIMRKSQSFTIDSLREIKREIGTETLVLAMGTDAAMQFSSWKNAEVFSTLCHIVVIQRPGLDCHLKDSSFESLGFRVAGNIEESIEEGIDAMHGLESGLVASAQLNSFEVSSSDIRERVREGKSIRYLVAGAVEAYICDNALYVI